MVWFFCRPLVFFLILRRLRPSGSFLSEKRSAEPDRSPPLLSSAGVFVSHGAGRRSISCRADSVTDGLRPSWGVRLIIYFATAEGTGVYVYTYVRSCTRTSRRDRWAQSIFDRLFLICIYIYTHTRVRSSVRHSLTNGLHCPFFCSRLMRLYIYIYFKNTLFSFLFFISTLAVSLLTRKLRWDVFPEVLFLFVRRYGLIFFNYTRPESVCNKFYYESYTIR